MSKRLPYFQFEPSEWLAGDIMFCSLSARGLFTDIMSLYWQKECKLTIDQVKRRFNCESELKELISENIIKIDNDNIIIEFLDDQLVKAIGKSKTNSQNGSKGGRPKKQKEPEENPNESEKKPNAFNSVIKNESEKKPIREDKIRESKVEVEVEVEKENKSNKNEGSDFDVFWDLYDKKVGDKSKLKKKWEKISADEKRKIFEYIPKYIQSRPDKQYRKDPATFLNNKSWNDEIISSMPVTSRPKSGFTPEQLKEDWNQW